MENKIGILHNMNEVKKTGGVPIMMLLGIILIALVLGTLSGFGLSKLSAGSTLVRSDNMGSAGDVAKGGKSAGIKDTKTFQDKAEGILKEGGIDGEGSYHLVRKPGQADQNAYLTSTAVDLSQFIGKKIRVWGETFQGEKAGWLMDVGYVEVIK